ncbi:MAG TPA: response regulator [Burkholderiaceae bacterium]|nr:response regulator [Burkholderiaceae bacterium]
MVGFSVLVLFAALVVVLVLAAWIVRLYRDLGAARAARDTALAEAARLNRIMDSLPTPVFIKAADTRAVTYVNRAALAISAKEREDFIGRLTREIWSPSYAARLEAGDDQLINGGRDVISDEFSMMLSGTLRELRTIKSLTRDPATGEPLEIVGMAVDNTEAAAAARVAERSVAYLRRFAESIDEYIFIAAQDRSRYHYVSPQFERVMGLPAPYSPKDIQRIVERIHPEDRALVSSRMALEADGIQVDIKFRFDHPERGMRWLRLRTWCLQVPGEEVLVQGMCGDITEEYESQLLLQRAKDEAEAGSRAKSQFLANMSHEIRTPMNGVLGMTEVLLGTNLDPSQRRHTETIYRSAESLLDTINDILDFSKIEAGHLDLSNETFTLRTVVEDLFELLAPRAHGKRIELAHRIENDIPAQLIGDPHRLRQVITNLVGNAIKFTDRGEVVLHARVDRMLPDGRVQLVISVIDTGMGIEPQIQGVLFQPFTQGNSTMSRRFGGTGLGLAISREIALRMGGDLRLAASTPGKGSVFELALPLAVAPLAGDPDDARHARLVGLRVLIVEDNPTNRVILENQLAQWGIQSVSAMDGLQGLDAMEAAAQRGQRFDLVLADRQMPVMDGLEMTREMRRRPHLRETMLAMLTSTDGVEGAAAAKQAGANGYLPKPVRQQELLNLLLELVSTPEQLKDARGKTSTQFRGRVLLVEDNPVNQEVVRAMVEPLGCTLRIANDGLDGLTALMEERFDLVLMDCQMPIMDGYTAVTHFRSGQYQGDPFVSPPNTPVVAVTAHAMEAEAQRCLAVGFDSYLAKPFKMRDIRALLETWIGLPNEMAAEMAADASVPQLAQPAAAPAPVAAGPSKTGSDELDPAVIQQLRDMEQLGAPGLLKQIHATYRSSSIELMERLLQSARMNDAAQVRFAAHTLKSASANVGAMNLSRLCAQLERDASEGRTEGMLKAAEKARETHVRVLACWEELIEGECHV